MRAGHTEENTKIFQPHTMVILTYQLLTNPYIHLIGLYKYNTYIHKHKHTTLLPFSLFTFYMLYKGDSKLLSGFQFIGHRNPDNNLESLFIYIRMFHVYTSYNFIIFILFNISFEKLLTIWPKWINFDYTFSNIWTWWWSTTTEICSFQHNKLTDLLIYSIQPLIIYSRINVLCEGIKTLKWYTHCTGFLCCALQNVQIHDHFSRSTQQSTRL
jgi:hypothetical protein